MHTRALISKEIDQVKERLEAEEAQARTEKERKGVLKGKRVIDAASSEDGPPPAKRRRVGTD